MQIKTETGPRLRKSLGLITQDEMADSLGVTREMLRYAIKLGRILAPSHAFTGKPRKYYLATEIELAKKAMAENT